MTEDNLAIYMPDEDIDRVEIGKELDFRFRPLVGKIANKNIKAGLLLSNMPLEEMKDDGSNARWVYYPFDQFINGDRLEGDFDDLIRILAECAITTEGDAISRFVCAFEGVVTKSRRSRLRESVSASISLSGPSIGIKLGQFVSIFSSKNSVRTNIYD